MELSEVTPTVLTYNEAANLAKLLPSLQWADNVVVLDSGSTDESRDVASQYTNVRWHEHPFESHAAQWSRAVKLSGRHSKWVLRLDADYELPTDFLSELAGLTPDPSIVGFWAAFDFVIHGRALRYHMFPGNLIMFRHDSIMIKQVGHTERIQPSGEIAHWPGRFRHHDLKPFGRFAQSQIRYARLEAELLTKGTADRLTDRLRRSGLLAVLVPAWLLVVKGLLLDGRPGLHYTMQRTLAEAMIALAYLDSKPSR